MRFFRGCARLQPKKRMKKEVLTFHPRLFRLPQIIIAGYCTINLGLGIVWGWKVLRIATITASNQGIIGGTQPRGIVLFAPGIRRRRRLPCRNISLKSMSSLENRENKNETLSSSSSSSSTTPSTFAPSKFIVDETTNKKWRLCAGVVVLHPTDNHRILIGERIGQTGAWQCPQGGVDATGESIAKAAERELYEEVGLVVGKHVHRISHLDADADAGDDIDTSTERMTLPSPPHVRYETGGTNSWLERNGFSGQELHWVLFRSNMTSNDDPNNICDLNGLGGEKPEFSKVKWEDIDNVVDGIWEKKRAPYAALKQYLKHVFSNENKK